MPDDGRVQFVEQTIELAARVLDNLIVGLEDIAQFRPLTPDRLAGLSRSDRYIVDGFLKRMSDAVEAGRGLFRAALIPLGENEPGLSFIDVLNKAEKFDVLPSARAWRDAVATRNKVVHEYAMSPADASVAIEEAIERGHVVAEQLGSALVSARQIARRSHDR